MEPERTDTRQRLFTAAMKVVRERGVGRLTLDAVAQAAGVSKGGLLYHFPSKEALLVALTETVIAQFETAIAREAEADPGAAAGRWVRAYARASLSLSRAELDLTAALLAAAGTDPALLAPWRAAFARWQAGIVADGLDPATATLVRLAVDGLWLADLLGLAPLDATLRGQVASELLRLAGATTATR